MSGDPANVVVRNTFIHGDESEDRIDALHRTTSDSCVVYGSHHIPGDSTNSQTAISRATLMTMRASKTCATQSHPMPRIAERPTTTNVKNTYIDDFVTPQGSISEGMEDGPPGVFMGASASMPIMSIMASDGLDEPRPQRSGSKEKPVYHTRPSIMTDDGFDDSWPLPDARFSNDPGETMAFTNVMTDDGFDDSWGLGDIRSTPTNDDDDRVYRQRSFGAPCRMSSKASVSRRISNMVSVTEDSVLEDGGPPGVFMGPSSSVLTNDGFDECRPQRSSSKEKPNVTGEMSYPNRPSSMTIDGFDDSWGLADSRPLAMEANASDDEEDKETRVEEQSRQKPKVTQKTLGERFPDRRKWSSMISVGSEKAIEEDEDDEGLVSSGTLRAQAAAAVSSASNNRGRRKSGRRNWGSVMTNDSIDDAPSSHPSAQVRRPSGQRPIDIQSHPTVQNTPTPYPPPPMVPAHPLSQQFQFYDPWYPWYGAAAPYPAPPSYNMGNMDLMQMSQMSNLNNTSLPQSNAPGKKKAGKGKRRRSLEGGAAVVAGRHTRTTLMLKNLPNNYTRDHVVALLNKEGFKGLFNFVYMPMCLGNMVSFGYAFVNLVSFVVADQCWSRFQGFSKWDSPQSKSCEVCWSDVQQGLQGNVEHFRSSQIMHESVPELAKPAIYMNGSQVPFPPPLRRLSAPQIDKRHPTESR